MKRTVRFKLNGTATTLDVDDRRKLLWVLRTELALTGTKYGCGEGLCGACTVLVGGQAQRACRVRVGAVAGREVTTIEGLARNGELSPLQRAFVEEGAQQCGFCTSGMIVNAEGLLRENPRPSRREIVRGMEGNLCRCGAHQRILRAVETAAEAAGEEGR